MGRGRESRVLARYKKQQKKKDGERQTGVSYKGQLYVIMLENGLPSDVSLVPHPIKAGIRGPSNYRESIADITIELRNEIIREYFKKTMN